MITTKINNVVILLSDEIFENFFIISNKKYPIEIKKSKSRNKDSIKNS